MEFQNHSTELWLGEQPNGIKCFVKKTVNLPSEIHRKEQQDSYILRDLVLYCPINREFR